MKIQIPEGRFFCGRVQHSNVFEETDFDRDF
jgi:hypothetical protein